MSKPASSPALPFPRGPLSAFVLGHLGVDAHPIGPAPEIGDADPLRDDDLHLALYVLYELHYRGFARVDDAWEWEPSLLAFRRRLERAFEAALRAEEVRPAGGLSLSSWILEHGTVEHLREFAIHRSAYQLKEADPHTWAIPRLEGRAKAAMVEIQADEYGNGVLSDMHAELFAGTMRALGLDPAYGAYLDALPGVTLASVNVVSMFGLHRRLRGALVGHLAGFEMTSVEPMRRYAATFDRLGVGESGRRFYDVHVEADAHHEVVAEHELVGGFLDAEPELADEVRFGQRALTAVEARLARHLLASWTAGRTSLLVVGDLVHSA